jgi:hypothetical protein
VDDSMLRKEQARERQRAMQNLDPRESICPLASLVDIH